VSRADRRQTARRLGLEGLGGRRGWVSGCGAMSDPAPAVGCPVLGSALFLAYGPPGGVWWAWPLPVTPCQSRLRTNLLGRLETPACSWPRLHTRLGETLSCGNNAADRWIWICRRNRRVWVAKPPGRGLGGAGIFPSPPSSRWERTWPLQNERLPELGGRSEAARLRSPLRRHRASRHLDQRSRPCTSMRVPGRPTAAGRLFVRGERRRCLLQAARAHGRDGPQNAGTA